MAFVTNIILLYFAGATTSVLSKGDLKCSEEKLQCPYNEKCIDRKDLCIASAICDKWENFPFQQCILSKGTPVRHSYVQYEY